MLFVFLDGVGLGPASEHNPLCTLPLPTLRSLAGDQAWTAEASPLRQRRHTVLSLDATLSIEGLPQSGTGQVSLFSGIDGVRLHGRHFGPYPPSATHGPLAEHSVYERLKQRGISADEMALANGYPERYFRAMEARNRWNTSSRMARAAGVHLRTACDLTLGDALPADFTGHAWQRHIDPDHVPISAEAAGLRLLHLAQRHRFTLYDYPHTDTAGHGRSGLTPEAILPLVDAFLGAIVGGLDPEKDLLVVSSDHGNIERPSTKSHTTNPVPLIALGPGADRFWEATSILDVTPAIVEALTG
ncbi:MAG: alkaline phosphatase family protein [Bacteroidota bacterium]